MLALSVAEAGSCGQGDVLDSDEFQVPVRFSLNVNAQGDRLANPLHQLIERFRLSMATAERIQRRLRRNRAQSAQRSFCPWLLLLYSH